MKIIQYYSVLFIRVLNSDAPARERPRPSRSKDLDEAVERLDGLAQAHHEEALDKYMWAVVEESKSERRVLAATRSASRAREVLRRRDGCASSARM